MRIVKGGTSFPSSLMQIKIIYKTMNKLISFILTLFITMGLSAQNKKTVVAYFSASGVTEGVAKRLAKEHNADIYTIEPAQKYTSDDLNWRNNKSRSSVEMKDSKARPALKESKSLAQYDVIYIGYPIWWNLAPRIINTFIEQADMDGKTVIPFATSGGSSITQSVSDLKSLYPNIKWQSGMLINR